MSLLMLSNEADLLTMYKLSTSARVPVGFHEFFEAL